MATGYRAGTHTVKVFPETATYGVREAGFDAGKLGLTCWDVGVTLAHEAIEDQAIRTNLGEWQQGVGLTHVNSEVTLSCYTHGLVARAGVGATPAENAVTYLVCACTGTAPIIDDGDKVLAGSIPTTIAVQETTAGTHRAKTLVAFEVAADGKTYVRPVLTYTGAPADTLNLGMALPTAPSSVAPNEDTIYGCINTRLTETHAYVIQGEFIGKQSFDSWEAYGLVGSLSIPQAAPSEAQSMQLTYKVGDHLYEPATSQTSPTPIARVIPAAGGEFLIAKHGVTANHCLDVLRIGLELGREYAPDPSACSDIGLQGYIVTGQQVRCQVVVRANDVPPAACTGATWYEVFANGEYLHLMAAYGHATDTTAGAGARFAFYLPKCHLVSEPEHGDTDGIATMTLTFGASQTYAGEDLAWFAQI